MTFRQLLRYLFSDSAVYGMAFALGQLGALLLLPLFGLYLGPEALGALALSMAALTLLSGVLMFGMDSSAGRWYWQETAENERQTTLSSWLVFLLGTALPVLLLLLAVPALGGWLQLTTRDVAVLTFLQLPFRLLLLLAQNWLRFQRRPVAVLLLAGLNLAGTLLGVAVPLVWLKLGLTGVLAGQCVVAALSALGGLWLVRQDIRWAAFSRPRLLAMLRYAAPLMPAMLGGIFMALADRWYLAWRFDMATVGYYHYAATLALVIGFLVIAFQQAWGPLGLSLASHAEVKQLYSRVLLLVTAGMSLAAFLFVLVMPWVLPWIAAPAFHGIEPLLLPLAFAAVGQAVYYMTAIGCNVAGNNWPVAMALGAAGLVKAVSLPLLGAYYGLQGVAWSGLLSSVAMGAVLLFLSERVYPVGYPWRRSLLIFLGFLLFALMLTS